MNQEVKKKWLEALRSGEYKKGIGCLKKRVFKIRDNKVEDIFCCLGVLCDLFSKEKGEKWVFNEATAEYIFLNHVVVLPYEVASWSGLNTYLFNHKKDGIITLISYNDHKKVSFKQIANVIEKNF